MQRGGPGSRSRYAPTSRKMPVIISRPSRSRGASACSLGVCREQPAKEWSTRIVGMPRTRSGQSQQVRSGILEMPRVPGDNRQAADNRGCRNQQVRAVMAQPGPETAPFARFWSVEGQNAIQKQGLIPTIIGWNLCRSPPEVSSPACGGGRVGARLRGSGSGGRSPVTTRGPPPAPPAEREGSQTKRPQT